MIQDFLLEIFGVHEEFDGARGETVLITLAPPIRNRMRCGAVLSSWQTNLCLDYFPFMYEQCKSIFKYFLLFYIIHNFSYLHILLLLLHLSYINTVHVL